MNRRSTPGAGQWLTVTLLVAASIFLLVKLFQYATIRSNYPTGLVIAGVDVGGLSKQQASEVLTNQFIEAPIFIYHREDRFEISPSQAKFQLDMTTMLNQADYERAQQDFWAGFWGFLWGRPIEVHPVPIAATHDREALRDVLLDIATLMDKPSQPPQPVPQSFSFQYGEAGTRTDIEASFADVEAAFYRPTNRESRLVVRPGQVTPPERNLLVRLLVNGLQDFEQLHNGVASMFIMDLATGREIVINETAPMSGMDMLKVPIVLEMYRVLDQPPTLTQRQHISNTLTASEDNNSANELLKIISGQDDAYSGAQQVTNSMRQLGLKNTFITVPYDEDPRPGSARPETEANTADNVRTNPSPFIQTTAEDMGTLLSMIYYCAEGAGGVFTAVYRDAITTDECKTILAFMTQNNIGSLIQEGVPAQVPIAHRHGWIADTHGDAGVVFSPGGDYVIVQFLYKPNWLEWEVSSPLLANMSRATYNYFNFDAPFLGTN
ncbi:MAG TPA: serine hydrolase [Chloroflexota bacterium]|nr:serine hydrolase [Chloroflexota bacterium]HUM69091.1 serine hydrolase [Chloroflexota bacterium]